MEFEAFKKQVNGLRKAGGWYTLRTIVLGAFVEIKGYGTWLQIFRVNEIQWDNVADCSVAQFNRDLAKPFIRAGLLSEDALAPSN